ncbi:hypothetical protein [Segnochrobactrum spirostomi]|uniref:Uncharacterized protein n=1 Tax=Segnochrobactrum spirostomi TaxID=2608987 RepID=A0A6A7Y1K1_9HYPH|nr:hypothetical protein [Segnochrobactrum spirostomi]MQT11991.1 hypothetical protein [Segnochrobactrum spirostomi]
MKRLVAAIFALLSCPVSAMAQDSETIAVCSESGGYAYYFEGGAVPPGQGGWRPDTIKSGSITLVRQANGTFDVIIGDAAAPRSASSMGGRIIPLPSAGGKIVLLVVYDGVTEQYIFDIASSKHEVIWTSARYGGLIDKAAVFHASCR